MILTDQLTYEQVWLVLGALGLMLVLSAVLLLLLAIGEQ